MSWLLTKLRFRDNIFEGSLLPSSNLFINEILNTKQQLKLKTTIPRHAERSRGGGGGGAAAFFLTRNPCPGF
jgi:hypothetical protein